MDNNRVLIIGTEGLVGSALLATFSKQDYVIGAADIGGVGTNMFFCDITLKDTLGSIFSQFKPNIVILTAALSNVEYCEEFPEKSEAVNIQGLKNVLSYLKPDKDKFVFFSSDYVFDGSDGPYAEDREPNPINVYGKHKLIAEKLISENIKHHLIIRTTGVYGPEKRGKNFVLSLIRNLKSGTKVKVPHDQIATPIYSLNLAQAVEEVVKSDNSGTYNIVGTDLVDRYAFAQEVCDIFELPKDLLIPVSTKELGQKALRPLKAGLITAKIEAIISTRLMGCKEGLRTMKREI